MSAAALPAVPQPVSTLEAVIDMLDLAYAASKRGDHWDADYWVVTAQARLRRLRSELCGYGDRHADLHP